MKSIKVYLLWFFIIAVILFQGCHNEIKEKPTAIYPDGKPGNYVVLSDSIIEQYQLDEKALTSFQYYLSDDLIIQLYNDNPVDLESNKSDKVTQIINNKTLFVKKFTPCTITKNIYPESEIKKITKDLNKGNVKIMQPRVSKSSYEEYLRLGQVPDFLQVPTTRTHDSCISQIIEGKWRVDLGNGISINYDSMTRTFRNVNAANLNFPYTRTELNNYDAAIIFDLPKPPKIEIQILSEDTIIVSGKRK